MSAITDLIAGVFGGLGKTAIDVRTAITGKDPAAEAKIQELIVQLDAQRFTALAAIDQAQLDVAKVEAASTNIFIAGARPAILWIGGFVILYTYVLFPFFVAFGLNLPKLDMAELWPVITGILGLGAMRTAEKFKRVAS